MVSEERIFDSFFKEKMSSLLISIDFEILNFMYSIDKKNRASWIQEFIDLRTQKIFILANRSIHEFGKELRITLLNLTKKEMIIFFEVRIFLSFFYRFFLENILGISSDSWNQLTKENEREFENLIVSYGEMKSFKLNNSEIKKILLKFNFQKNRGFNFNFSEEKEFLKFQDSSKLILTRDIEVLKSKFPFEFYYFSQEIPKISDNKDPLGISSFYLSFFMISPKIIKKGVVKIEKDKIYRLSRNSLWMQNPNFLKTKEISLQIKENQDIFKKMNNLKKNFEIDFKRKFFLEQLVDFISSKALFSFELLIADFGGNFSIEKEKYLLSDLNFFKKLYNTVVDNISIFFEKKNLKYL